MRKFENYSCQVSYLQASLGPIFKELLEGACFEKFIMDNMGILQPEHFMTSVTKLR